MKIVVVAFALLFILMANTPVVAAGPKSKPPLKGAKTMESVVSLPWKKMKDAKYVASYGAFAHGIRGKIQLNGVTLQASGGDGLQMSSNLPQYFLRRGANQLEVEIMEAIHRPQDEPQRVAVELSFHALSEPGIPDETNRVSHLLLKASEIKVPFHKVYTIQLDSAPPSKLWTDAEAVTTVSSSDRQSIEALLKDFINTLKTSNFDQYKKSLEYAVNDQEAANYGSGEEAFASQKKMFPKISSKFTNTEFDFSKLRLASAMGGLVWFLVADDGSSFVKAGAATESFTVRMDLGVSRIRGKWLISRTEGDVQKTPPQSK